AYLRAVDVKILQQLVVVNEGIEAVKWLLEEKRTLTSRCRRHSISTGSSLDTRADDMDEYSQNAAEPVTASAPGRALARAEQDWARIDLDRGLPAKQEKGKVEHEWPHADHLLAGLPQDQSCLDQQRFAKEPQVANGYFKAHLEYDAHWRWLQSQDDVTFL
ncbi:Leucine rich adaptor protein 1, partial [Struthio camelus australis]